MKKINAFLVFFVFLSFSLQASEARIKYKSTGKTRINEFNLKRLESVASALLYVVPSRETSSLILREHNSIFKSLDIELKAKTYSFYRNKRNKEPKTGIILTELSLLYAAKKSGVVAVRKGIKTILPQDPDEEYKDFDDYDFESDTGEPQYLRRGCEFLKHHPEFTDVIKASRNSFLWNIKKGLPEGSLKNLWVRFYWENHPSFYQKFSEKLTALTQSYVLTLDFGDTTQNLCLNAYRLNDLLALALLIKESDEYRNHLFHKATQHVENLRDYDSAKAIEEFKEALKLHPPGIPNFRFIIDVSHI